MPTVLWLTVIVSGVYHGVNPGMGWPLAVSAGLMGKGRRDLIASLGPLGAGHFLAMAGILAPFAAMTALVAWQHEIRIGAGLVVIAAGAYLLVARRHPRFLARIKPTQLALWSFTVATVHGAGLMLLPIYLGICTAEEQDIGHLAMTAPVEHPALGQLDIVRNAVRMTGGPPTVRAPSPEPGRHSDEVLAELGYPAAEVARLRDQGVI